MMLLAMRLRLLKPALVGGAILAVLLAVTDVAAAPPVTGWLTFGGTSANTSFLSNGVDPTRLHELASRQLEGYLSAQPLVVRGAAGGTTVYVATSHGVLYALDADGRALAQRQLGQMVPPCPYFDDNRFGITATPVVDPASGTLYVADATGSLYALDPATLATEPGWPIRLVRNPRVEHVWGALTLAGGRLYVGTGLVCGRANGHLLAVDPQTRRVVARWQPVPSRLGGGGGIWGWGGATYDARTGSILVLTGDALPGGANTGKRFDEAAGYAEHLVRLTPDLHVVAASTPAHYRHYVDWDLVGSPVVVRAAGCPGLVAAEDKNGSVYVWRLDRIGRGPIWGRRLETQLMGQPAWSPLTRSLYVAGYSALHRIAIGRDCRPALRWSTALGKPQLNGAPLVAGGVVWLGTSTSRSIWALDASTGKPLWKARLGQAMFAQPTVLDGRVYAAGWDGLLKIFGS